jgi:Tol biopolymer transport system component
VRQLAGHYSIFAVPSSGGSERRLADFGAREVRSISWAPDGRYLALSVQLQPHEPYVVALFSLETLEERVLSQPPADYFGDVQPVYSPDGSHIAYVRRVMEKVDDVFVTSLNGEQPVRLTSDHADVTGLDWSPDGRDVIYTSDREGNSSLWRIPRAGGTPLWIPIMGEGAGVYQLSVARRLWRMTFVERSLDTNLWELDLETGASRAVVSSTRLDDDPAVSPSGEQIAFVSNRMGSFEVWVSARDGSTPVQVTELGGPFVSSPEWSPDGSQIAFVARVTGQVDVYTVDVVGGTPRRITTRESNDKEPHWSNDGEWIYFSSNRSGAWEIWKKPANLDGESVQITRNGGYAAMESPDGEWLYFVKRTAAGIYRMPLPEGEEEMVLGEFEPLDWGNWAIDSSGLFFLRRSESGASLMRKRVESGELEALTEFSFFPKSPGLAVYPGGKTILYAQVDRRDSDILLVEEFR